ncbi:hypothetical protein [Nostoc sp.]
MNCLEQELAQGLLTMQLVSDTTTDTGEVATVAASCCSSFLNST